MTESGHPGFALNLLPHLLSWQDREGVVVFDGEGRLFSLYHGDSLYRRGLDGSVQRTRRVPTDGHLVRSHRTLDDREARFVFTVAWEWAKALEATVRESKSPAFAGQSTEGLIKRLRQVLGYTPDVLFQERERFSALYKPVSVLPPDQYMALVVQLTHGCPYNECIFCDLYQDRSYHVKSPTELKQWLPALKKFLGRTLGMRKGIFLGDGNCLALPARGLLPLLEIVNSAFDGDAVRDKGVFSFADTRAVVRKSREELSSLARAGLKRVYLGLETGSQALLSFLRKPGSRDEQIESVNRLKAAGLQAGVIFMTGIGGRRFAQEHITQTVELIRSLPLGPGDLVYLSRFYAIPGTPYAQEILDRRIELLGDKEVDDQFEQIRSAIRQEGVKVAPYDLGGFIY